MFEKRADDQRPIVLQCERRDPRRENRDDPCRQHEAKLPVQLEVFEEVHDPDVLESLDKSRGREDIEDQHQPGLIEQPGVLAGADEQHERYEGSAQYREGPRRVIVAPV